MNSILYVSPLLKGWDVLRRTAEFRAQESIRGMTQRILDEGKNIGMNESHIEVTIGRKLTEKEKETLKLVNNQEKLMKTVMRLIFEAKGRGFSEGYRVRWENHPV
ncbi:hypothetical protein B7C51_08540 [Paenibacillus larvae subsp. pulvifaciens]|uniref:Uncharacterized protein n=1 Tax=Paenibacillus larvae subsp. pulvifaciens TaxID=1477 RepID=A0A1V0USD6_9BACL|nr:hypothetical protein [Paenibacillus larvae]ARF67868.1 hypothetical protein B7C51_08540 [Paenibacillus larvae subsp. pulvifaciens]